MKVLVTTASKEGATSEISEAIAQTLRKRGLETTVSAPERVEDVRGYDAFVIGSSVVCGTRGVSAFAGAFLGSFTQQLLHIAPCPVLAVGPRSELNAVLHHASTGARA